MNKSTGVSYIKSNRPAGNPAASHAIVSSISKEAARDLSELLQSMFDGIDDSLFELANSARTNNEQNRFFEAMREIRIKRKGIESQFSQAILGQFLPDQVHQQETDHTDNVTRLDSLSVVGNDELEEDVAITAMASKAKANFQGALLKFQTRMSRAYGAHSLDAINPPLEPKAICEAFANACQELEIEIKEKLIVFKQFDRYVISNLEPVLEHANKLLIRHGILPQLRTPGIRAKSAPRSGSESIASPSNAQARLQEGHQTTGGAGQARSDADIFPELQALLAGNRHPAAKTSESVHTTQTRNALDTNALLTLLTALQKQPHMNTTASKDAKVIDIRSALQDELANRNLDTKQPAAFNQLDEDLINLVSMLFEFILDDYNLAPPIQVLISRLQIPILKVVIKDKNFFSSNRHPARQLLNALAKAGIGWGTSTDHSRDKLYVKIHDTVHKVLEEFDGDVALFTRLNDDFSAFMQREERKAKIVEQRTKEAEKGRIRSKQAQKRVEDIISNKILNARHAIPQVISEMLKNGWSRVMFLAYLKDDQEHQWAPTVKVVDDLIWCLQPLTEVKDRQRWVAIVPKLLKDLKSGLENVSYSTSSLDETMREIKQELTSAFKNPDNIITGNEISSPLPSPQLKETAVEKQLASRIQDMSRFENAVDELKVGQWVEFELLNGNKFRCKLSAKIEEADCYIFVNRMGLKTVEKSRAELAQDLSKNKVLFLEQGQVIDRALNAVMSNLKQKADS